MNKLLINSTAILLTSLLSTTAHAAVEANIGATSNYLWRGVTQTDDAVAVQGGIDYSHDSGFYAGTWASNVDFGDETSYEVDFYAGFAGTIGDEFEYDLSYLYYA
ncbi:TorF family putative porin, partial [Shewanella sp. 0m-11]